MIYRMQEGCLTLEGEWQDRTIHMLAALDLPASGSNLVVSRERLPAGLEFKEYVSQQKTSLKRELAEFEELSDTQSPIDQTPARYLEFTWKGEGGTAMHQMLMVIECKGSVLTLTATIPGDVDRHSRDALLGAMRSFTFGPDREAGGDQG